jgi:chlorobactene glucosyltransferase
MWRTAFLFFAVVANAYFFVMATSNVLHFRHATRKPRLKGGLFVSVIVPARDEELNIARCIESLLAQDYADYEVIVVDDASSDATARIVTEHASGPRLRLVSGAPLPEGWMGKQHALSQGAAVARGDVLMFTDADTVHRPESVSWVVTNMEDHRADFISGYLRQEALTFGERLIVPTQYAMMMFIPLALLPYRNSSKLAFAIGQLVAVKRDAFDGAGGFGPFRDSVVDDMSMARRLKGCGYRTAFLDATGVASCRLYADYRTAFHGTMRSIFGAVGGTFFTVLAMSCVVLGAIVYPPAAVLWALASRTTPSVQLTGVAVLFVMTWGLIALDRDVPLTSVFLYPLVFLDLVLILVVSMVRTGYGRGVDWKGRIVRVGGKAGVEDAGEGVFFRIASVPVYWTVFAAVWVANRVWFRTRVRGRENLGALDGPCFIISNHSFFLDPAAVAYALFPRRIQFTALSTTFSNPFYGGLLRMLGGTPLQGPARLHGLRAMTARAFARGRSVHFFPEGEMVLYNRRLRPFKKGVFLLAQLDDVPVLPVTIIWQHRDRGLLRRFRLAVSVEIGEPMFVPGLRDARAGEATSPALRPSEEVAAFAEFAHGRIQGMIDRSMASR